MIKRMHDAALLLLVLAAALTFSRGAVAESNPGVDVIVINAAAPAHPFPHFWEHMFGSGRAILSLRDSYRQRSARVKASHRRRVHPLPRHLSGRNRRLRRRQRRATRSTTFPTSIRSTTALSQTASAPLSNSASCRRSWPPTRTPSCFLVQAKRRSAERLGQVGRPDLSVHEASGRPLRHRGSFAVVFRSLERTQYRLLGREIRNSRPTSISTITPQKR